MSGDLAADLAKAIQEKDDMKAKALQIMQRCKALEATRLENEALIKSLQHNDKKEVASPEKDLSVQAERYKQALDKAVPKLKALQAANETLRKENDELKGKIADTTHDDSGGDGDDENFQLKSSLKELRESPEEASEKDKELIVLKENLVAADTKIDQFNKIIKAKAEEVADLVQKIGTLEEISNNKTEQQLQLQDDYNTLTLKLDRAMEEINDLKKKSQINSEQTSAMDKDLKDAHNKARNLEVELKEARESASEAQASSAAEIHSLQAMVKKLGSDSQDTAASLQAELLKIKADCARLEESEKRKAIEVDNLQAELRNAHSDFATQRQQEEAKAEQLTLKAHHGWNVIKQLAGVMSEEEAEKIEVAEAAQLAAEKLRSHDELTNAHSEKKGALEKAKEDLEKVHAQHAAREAEVINLQTRLEDMSSVAREIEVLKKRAADRASTKANQETIMKDMEALRRHWLKSRQSVTPPKRVRLARRARPRPMLTRAQLRSTS